jgi:hypothetical protein
MRYRHTPQDTVTAAARPRNAQCHHARVLRQALRRTAWIMAALATAACWLVATAPAASAQMVATISVEKTIDLDGRFRYEYLIQNDATSSLTVNTFVLDVGDGADLQALVAPAGWLGDYAPAEDPFELAFVSEQPQADIPIGGQGTFAFTSPLDAAPLPYFVAKLLPDGVEQGSIFGDIDSPAVAPQPPLLGDVNLDEVVNGLDVDPFVDVLLNDDYQVEADMNQDTLVNGLDVDPFVAAVVGGGGVQAVAEPSTVLLAAVAMLGLALWRRRNAC